MLNIRIMFFYSEKISLNLNYERIKPCWIRQGYLTQFLGSVFGPDVRTQFRILTSGFLEHLIDVNWTGQKLSALIFIVIVDVFVDA